MRRIFCCVVVTLALVSTLVMARGATAPPPYGAGLGNIGDWLEPGPIWGWENDPWGWGTGSGGWWNNPGGPGGTGSGPRGTGGGGAGWGGWNGSGGMGSGLGGHDWGFDGDEGGGSSGGSGGVMPVDAGLPGTCWKRVIGTGAPSAGDFPKCSCRYAYDVSNPPKSGDVVVGSCVLSDVKVGSGCINTGDRCEATRQ